MSEQEPAHLPTTTSTQVLFRDGPEQEQVKEEEEEEEQGEGAINTEGNDTYGLLSSSPNLLEPLLLS